MKPLLEFIQLQLNDRFALVFMYCAPMVFVGFCFWFTVAPIAQDTRESRMLLERLVERIEIKTAQSEDVF